MMTKQKISTKTAKQTPEAKTEKTKRVSGKAPIQTTPPKRPASSSKDKKPIGRNVSTEKKGNKKSTIEKPIAKVGRATQMPNKFSKKHSDDNHSSLSAKDKIFKKKLESMAKAIDLLKKTSSNSDVIDLENTFGLICKHIFFFLKSLPEVKDSDLLIAYSKLYKKLERFMKSATFDLECIDDVPIDDHVENNILIEKVMENDVIFYRTTYSTENRLISIFCKDGKPICHYKIKTNGKQEKIPNVFGAGRIVFENTSNFETENEKDNYDGTKYTVLGSAKVNKDLYGNCLGENFDSIYATIEKMHFRPSKISLGEPLDLNAVKVMLEKGVSQNVLSNMKNKERSDAKMKIMFLNSMKNNGSREKQTMQASIFKSKMTTNDLTNQMSPLDKLNAENHAIKPTVSLRDELVSEISSPKENKPTSLALFGDVSIYKGKSNLLYADAKSGKTFFSIEVAKSEYVKKPLFITLDDFSPDLNLRYEANLAGKNYDLIKLDDFDSTYEIALKERKRHAEEETLKDIALSNYRRIKIYTRQNYVDMGIIKKRSDALDKVAVFKKIIVEALDDEYDFICLDCLHSIVEGNGRSLNRDQLISILKPISERHVTFLLIHHTNKDPETMSLTHELRYVFDNIYRLELKKNFDDGSSDLELIEENARHNTPHVVTIKRSFVNDFNVIHNVVHSEVHQPKSKKNTFKRNIKAMLIDILMNEEANSISYDDLINNLKEVTGKENDEANIMKHLKSINSKEKLISMKDGSTWKGGINIDKQIYT